MLQLPWDLFDPKGKKNKSSSLREKKIKNWGDGRVLVTKVYIEKHF